MTLISSMKKKMQSRGPGRGHESPPPGIDAARNTRKGSSGFKYDHVRAKVDTSAPRGGCARLAVLAEQARRHRQLFRDNLALLLAIKRMHFTGGRVECRWKDKELPTAPQTYFEVRRRHYQHLNRENEDIYKRLLSTRCLVSSAAEHRREWARSRAETQLRRAGGALPAPAPAPNGDLEAFRPPPGVQRPRVYITLRIQGGVELGELQIELFTETCPNTCRLFLQLLDGDGLGHGYVGTHFYRKVPPLYWSGGDVVHDNGLGCYSGRVRAENYHYSHCAPGLLSMCATRDHELCGAFNITFKPLLQFDLKNVVFGRVIRPSETYNAIQGLGSPLTARPVVELCAARRKLNNRWVRGAPNTRLVELRTNLFRK